MDQVYSAKLLEFAGNNTRIGQLEVFDASASAYSRLCGSKVTVWLKFDGDKVHDFSHEVKACALGQAASSIVAANIVGASFSELRDARAQMWDLLVRDGPIPLGRFSDLKYLEPVRDYKARHASTMLSLDAVVKAIDQAQAQVTDQPPEKNGSI